MCRCKLGQSDDTKVSLVLTLRGPDSAISCKHKRIRKYGSGVANTRTYEATVLQEVTCDHVAHLTKDQKCILTAHLVQPHPMHKKLQTWMVQHGVLGHQIASTSSEARLVSGAMVKKGDYVLFRATPPLLYGCAEVCCLLHKQMRFMLRSSLSQTWWSRASSAISPSKL